jgi:CCR4-NOT transcription complex subunit 3
VCEKEAKTKMFSKEGLAREQKLDPQEAAKNATREWLQESVEKLNRQMEAFDADLERLSSGKGEWDKGEGKGYRGCSCRLCETDEWAEESMMWGVAADAAGRTRNKDEIAHLEESLSRHRRHVAKLEQITRLMDNDHLDPASIDEVRWPGLSERACWVVGVPNPC